MRTLRKTITAPDGARVTITASYECANAYAVPRVSGDVDAIEARLAAAAQRLGLDRVSLRESTIDGLTFEGWNWLLIKESGCVAENWNDGGSWTVLTE